MHRSVLLLLFLAGALGERTVDPPGEFFSFIAIPDTQYISAFFRELFEPLTYYCCACAQREEVVFVTHLGDIVEHATGHLTEWRLASTSMRLLENCGLPYGILPGNHDVYTDAGDTGDLAGSGVNGTGSTSYRNFDMFFPLSRFLGNDDFPQSTFQEGFPPGTARNSYHLITVSGNKLLFMELEFLPSSNYAPELIAWATGVLQAHPDRFAVLSTHYAGFDCVDHIEPRVSSLLFANCNLRLALGGHFFSCGGERATPLVNSCGNTSWVLVSDFQARAQQGWLRQYHMTKDLRYLTAFTISPTVPNGGTQVELDQDSHFTLDLLTGSLFLDGDPRMTGLGPSVDQATCISGYTSPGYVFATLWIILVTIHFILFSWMSYP